MAKYAQILVHTLPYNKENAGSGGRSAMSQNDNEKDDVFLILTGLGGSADGFGNKYGHICDFVQKDYGFSTFVVQTPQDIWERKNTFLKKSRQITYKIGGGYILWACRQGRALHYGMRPAIRRSGAFCV